MNQTKAIDGKLAHRNRMITQRICSVALALCLTGLAVTSESGQHIDRFRVGEYPAGMAFDGENIWVTHQSSNGAAPAVTKLRAADGSIVGQFRVPSFTQNAVFDGTYVWVTDWQYMSHTVTRLRLDGTVEGTYEAGQYNPSGILFDGENIWTVSSIGYYLVKMRGSDAAIIGTYPLGIRYGGSYHLAYDGENIWVAAFLDNNVVKVRASDGTILGTFTAGQYPLGIVFDGANIWVGGAVDNTLNELNTDGVTLHRVQLVGEPGDLAFDGAHIWVTDYTNNTVLQLGLNGRVIQTFRTGGEPNYLLYDGDNIWCTNFLAGTVTKIHKAP
jgi:DNA-binding beta-propeller fold protein YncE